MEEHIEDYVFEDMSMPVFLLIGKRDGFVGVPEIAEELKISVPSASRWTASLSDGKIGKFDGRGLVTASLGPDGTSKFISLTPKGKELYTAIAAAFQY